MLANRRNLSEIFEQTVRLVAPLFQRPYVWNQERNWEALWTAIEGAANRRLGATGAPPHFLGAVVLNQQWTPMGQVPSREIIDGQQRLTTLQLAMAGARDILAEWGSEFYAQRLRSLTKNHTRFDDEQRFKVWPTNRDRKSFAATMIDGAVLAEVTPPGSNRLVDAYRFFRDRALAWLDEEGEVARDARAEALTTAFTQDLILVVIDLDQEDDGQLIFETLNALGTPLLPSDLVKNLLFHESEKANLDSDGLYERYWAEFDENEKYWREELRVGRLKRPRLDVFLQHYLTIKWRKFIPAEGSFRAYRELITEWRFQSVEYAFEDFRRYADLYRSFDSSTAGSVEASFFKRFWVLDTQAVVPIILELFYQHPLSGDRGPFLQDLESYFFRRAICQLSAASHTNMVVEMLNYLDKHGWTHDVFRTFLTTREGDRTRWPNDDEFQRAVTERPIYSRVLQWRLVQLLKLYEESLHGELTDPVTYNGELTLEHIMPRSWDTHWPLDDPDDLESKQRRALLVDSLGNLTLVTSKLNASLSNSPWIKKREAIKKHAVLRMNHELLEADAWSESAIRARGERLFDLFRNLWPRPAGAEPLSDELGPQGGDSQEAPLPTFDDLKRLVIQLAGQELRTGTHHKVFVAAVEGDSLIFTPADGTQRGATSRTRAERVLERFESMRSLRPSEYMDLTFNASYLLALVERWLGPSVRDAPPNQPNC